MKRRACRQVAAVSLISVLLAAPVKAGDAFTGGLSVRTEPWPMDFDASAKRFVEIGVVVGASRTEGVFGRLEIVASDDAEPSFLLQGDTRETKTEAKGKFPSRPVDYFSLVLIAEGLIAVNSYLATLSPDVYGGLVILLAPFAGAFCEPCDTAEAVVGGIGLAGIGAYNLTLDEDALSSNDIFWKNFVAWQVVAAAMGIAFAASEHHARGSAAAKLDGKESGWTLSAFPVRDGMGISYTYRY